MVTYLSHLKLGEIPKRLKGAVSKTVSGVMLQPGFESLFLRQSVHRLPSGSFFRAKNPPSSQKGGGHRVEIDLVELRSGFYKRLAGVVGFVFDEILLEAASQIFGFAFPNAFFRIRIARIKDMGVYAREFRRNFEIEERDLLGRSGKDRST